jgi:phytoene desaturase
VGNRTFVVVGAGLGGLATALRLAHRGHRVTVLEKTDQVGGRNRSVTVGESRFDAGPTLLMMLDPFYRLFADVGESLDDHLSISRCDPSYRAFYADGTRLEASSDIERMASVIEGIGGREEAAGFRHMMRDLEGMYADAIPAFVRKNFRGPLDFFGPRQLGLVARHRMLGNLASRVAEYVKDERLRMLFSFQTMYLGLSPFRAPWVYSVLTYMEYGEGIWYPKGGIAEISRAIARLAEARGAVIRTESPVCRIKGGQVILESGETIDADAVICNADLPYAESNLVGNPPRDAGRRRYSCSAYMMYIDYEGSLPDLLHHNVFFGPDFQQNLEQIFKRMELPNDPAFYAAVSVRSDPDQSISGHENLYLLVPCPNLDRPWTAADGNALQQRVFVRLTREAGFDPSRVRSMRTYTPADWAADLNLDRGAAFGLSHDFWQSAYFRPQNRSHQNPSVYFVGASTIPGNGMPMVLISAELAEQRLERDDLLS